jgi:putative Mn2+ efflux pump MntP
MAKRRVGGLVMQQDYKSSQIVPSFKDSERDFVKEAKFYLITDLMIEALKLEVDSFVIGVSFEIKERKTDTIVNLNGRVITND